MFFNITLFNASQFFADIICCILLIYCSVKKTQYQKLSLKFDLNIKILKQVVHDVRSPLSALEIIVKHLPASQESKCVLARNAIAHIRDITDNLAKENSAGNTDDYASVQIVPLLDYAISERRAAFSMQKIKIDAVFSADANTFFTRVIPHELKCILINIINNAYEALPSHIGTISVFLSRIDADAIVIISDDGVGFSEKMTSMFFTRGFTTKSQGSGLGLSHAKENIEQWGGSIELRANKPRGASVVISLPLATL